MTEDLVSASLSQLPPQIKDLIGGPFIKAYTADHGKKIVVWYLTHTTGKQKEIEFSVQENRVLSRAERERGLPRPKEVPSPDPRFRVVKSYELAPDTDTLHETYTIYDRATNDRLADSSHIYFSNFPTDPVQLVNAAVKEAGFPARYGGWSSDEKVNHWIGVVYRARRSAGEQGVAEEAAFSPDLISEMQKTDPDIHALLPDIIKGVARMDMSAPEDMAAAFNRRTGLSIRL